MCGAGTGYTVLTSPSLKPLRYNSERTSPSRESSCLCSPIMDSLNYSWYYEFAHEAPVMGYLQYPATRSMSFPRPILRSFPSLISCSWLLFHLDLPGVLSFYFFHIF